MDIVGIASQFAALAGAGALIALVVNVGKTLGVIKDGQAPTASLVLNLAGVAALIALQVFQPGADVAALDGVAGQIASAGVTLFGLFVQLYGSKLGHGVVAGVPVLGKSHSLDNTGSAPHP